MAEMTEEMEFFDDSQMQDSYEIINVNVDLPDLEDTQIVYELPDQVSTYSMKSSKQFV